MGFLKRDRAVKTHKFKKRKMTRVPGGLRNLTGSHQGFLKHSLQKINPRSDQNWGATGKTITRSGKAFVSFHWHLLWSIWELISFHKQAIRRTQVLGFAHIPLATCIKEAQVCKPHCSRASTWMFFKISHLQGHIFYSVWVKSQLLPQ